MKERDLDQISQLRRLREEQKNKALLKARHELREAEAAFFHAQQEREARKQKAAEEEKRQWKELVEKKKGIAGETITTLHTTVDQFKLELDNMAQDIAVKQEFRDEKRLAIPKIYRAFQKAQREKESWKNLREKLDEEQRRLEEIALEELNAEIRLRKNIPLRNAKPPNRE